MKITVEKIIQPSAETPANANFIRFTFWEDNSKSWAYYLSKFDAQADKNQIGPTKWDQ